MDLSTLTDAELDAMIAAQSGGAIAAAPTAQPAPQLESNWLNTLAGTTAKAGQGIFGGFLDEMAAGATAPLDVLGGLLSGNQVSLSDAYSQNLARNRAALAAFGEQVPVLSTASEIGGAILSPINKLGLALKGVPYVPQAVVNATNLVGSGALQGAIYGAGYSEGNENIIDDALSGAKFGGAVSGAIGAASKPLGFAGDQLTKWGRGTKNKLYGLHAKDIKKSLGRDATGSAKGGVARVEQALDDLIKEKAITAGSATDNALAIGEQIDELATQTKQVFNAVDSVQPQPVQPTWESTRKYIKEQLSDADRPKAERIFNKYKDSLEQNNALLSEFEHQKSIFQKKGKDALGPEGRETIESNLFNMMGLDLKKAVDDELANPIYAQTLGKDAVKAVQGYRKSLADRKLLQPSLREGMSREATEGFNDWLINTLKTTGGFGVPAYLGYQEGGLQGALTGLAAGAALRSTPAQQALIGLLRGGGAALSSTGTGLQGAALPASRALAAMLTGNEAAPEQMESASAEIDLSQLSDEELDAMIAAATPADTALPTAEAEGFERTSFIPKEMPEMTLTSDRGIDFIKQHEGLRLTAYDDGTGKRTIGYGHTADVPDKITKEEAEAKLIADIEDHESAVKELVKVPLTQEQFDALTSFTFNLGAGALKRSTLLKKINAGDLEGAADEFLKWNKARVKGKLVPMRGLTKRRKAERELFLEGLTTKDSGIMI